MKNLNLKLNQRAVLVRDGRAVKALGPGRHTLWKHYDVVMFDTDKLAFTAPDVVIAGLPADWYETVQLAPKQYGIVTRDERAVAFLRPGVHYLWKVDRTVRLRVFDHTDPLPPLDDDLRKLIPAGELLETTLDLNQRGVLVRDGAPERVLEPGFHAFWGTHNKLLTWKIDDLAFWAQPEVLAILPPAWFTTLELGPSERAVIVRDAKPRLYLRPGLHRVWMLDPNVAIRTFDILQAPPALTDELRAIIPATELIEAEVKQFERGLMYVQGKYAGMLDPGRHAFWNHQAARVAVIIVDTRVQQLKIEGQELMTRDKVTLRLTLTAEYAPADAPTTAHAVADVKDALYLAVQLAAREFVAGVTLDELLEGRDALARYLEGQVAPRAEHFGVRLHRVGVKDVILPGEMKTLLNKVIEAEKVAAANVITRREDAAATRNMAQTAKVIADNPVLMRLKELETMRDIAEKIDEIKLVVGADKLDKLFANN
ncbi:MAG TPA: SPFH domain-containing protein [Kofleriaceae bacterium]|jgi:regulator of protease activity HflC (stomatin/prohibitin superfamily)